jgi:hypothetical protein
VDGIERPVGNTDAERGLAALAVAEHARDADECLKLLMMLGLDRQVDERGPGAHQQRASPQHRQGGGLRGRKVG